MVIWRVEFSENAENAMAILDKPIRQRVIGGLEWLSGNFDTIVPLPLGNRWRGFFKFRVGDWRVIYEIKPNEYALKIHYIDHRSKIYKRG